MDKWLTIYETISISQVNGPGKRFVVWFQGCPFHCKGCFNPALKDPGNGNGITVGQLTQQILATPGIEGVTFSGGEPFMQAETIAVLAEDLQRNGLSVFCYTGYRYEELLALDDPGVKKLLEQIDILVDGHYEETCIPVNSMSGSGNQNLILLSDRYQGNYLNEQTSGGRLSEVIILEDGTIKITGFIPDLLS